MLQSILLLNRREHYYQFYYLFSIKTTTTTIYVDQELQTPKKTMNKYNLFIKENFQRMRQRRPIYGMNTVVYKDIQNLYGC
jgi:hypothetical protein